MDVMIFGQDTYSAAEIKDIEGVVGGVMEI